MPLLRNQIWGCLLGVLLGAVSALAQETPPNIVFIMADDLGYGDLGCYGQKQIQTPHLDQLAKEGTRFTDFYAGSTVCAPSRCVLMTGLHTGHAQIRGNAHEPLHDSLRAEDVTFPMLLQQHGYHCGMFGKWGLGPENSPGLPLKKGFDEFVGFLDQRHAHNYYPTYLIRGSSRFALNNVVPNEAESGAGVATEKGDYAQDIIANAALDYIRQNQSRPFFVYMPITLPHANNEARLAGMEIPDLGEYAARDWSPSEKGFAAMVTRADSDAGRVLALLKELQLQDRTLVIFASDNGPHKEGGHSPEFFDSNGPVRGIKRDMYDGGIRVPFIAAWPGHIPAGRVSSHVGYLGDLFATVCDLTHIPLPAGLDSISLLPELLGQTDRQKQHDFLYWEFYERGFCQAVRQGDWKYVSQNGKEELFNLADDIGETHDLSAQEPERLQTLQAIARREHVPHPNWIAKPAGKAKAKAADQKNAGQKNAR